MIKLNESYSYPVMTSFFRPLTAICCSVALVSLSGCGGSSTEAEGFAPEDISNCRLNVAIPDGVVGGLDIGLPPQFEIEFNNKGRFTIIDRGENIDMWHDEGISVYHRTGDGNTASLTLIFNSEDAGDEGTETTRLEIVMPNLTFRDEYYATSIDSTISARETATNEVTGTGTATIHINILSRGVNEIN